MLEPEERSVLDTIASQVLEIKSALGASAGPTGPGHMERLHAALPKPGTPEHDALPPAVQEALLTIASHAPGSFADVEPPDHERR